jgi:hypothetical protein
MPVYLLIWSEVYACKDTSLHDKKALQYVYWLQKHQFTPQGLMTISTRTLVYKPRSPDDVISALDVGASNTVHLRKFLCYFLQMMNDGSKIIVSCETCVL